MFFVNLFSGFGVIFSLPFEGKNFTDRMNCISMRTAKVLFLAAGVALIQNGSAALTVDNPYHTIVERNPFGLNPPPTVTPTNVVESPRNIKFNGITAVRGKKKAFFTIAGKDPKDPPKFVTLSVSERDDILEVTKIFKEEGEVEVVNSGVKMVLNFKKNGNQPNAAPVAGVPAAVPSAVVYSPVPAVAHPMPSPGSTASSPVLGGVPTPSPQTAIFNPISAGGVVAQTGIGRNPIRDSGQQLGVADQEALMRLSHETMAFRVQTGQRDIVNYSATGPKDPNIHAPTPSSGPRRMVIDPPPPLPGQ